MPDLEVIWDLDDDPEGNVLHIREHDVSQDEVDEILRNPRSETTVSRSSGERLTFGWTSTGRCLAVVWELVNDDPRTAFPITAYPVEPPMGRKHGRKSRHSQP